jgi:hypothetical protein
VIYSPSMKTPIREMQPAVVRGCLSGHKFYGARGALVPCPYCLSHQVKLLREELERIRLEDEAVAT